MEINALEKWVRHQWLVVHVEAVGAHAEPLQRVQIHQTPYEIAAIRAHFFWVVYFALLNLRQPLKIIFAFPW